MSYKVLSCASLDQPDMTSIDQRQDSVVRYIEKTGKEGDALLDQQTGSNQCKGRFWSFVVGLGAGGFISCYACYYYTMMPLRHEVGFIGG